MIDDNEKDALLSFIDVAGLERRRNEHGLGTGFEGMFSSISKVACFTPLRFELFFIDAGEHDRAASATAAKGTQTDHRSESG
ncbi:hypothetical protein [Haladaptatus sp. T7]|uniref:hypothetical protein n=1 Tax=Haladaptatus sp. T7 TaxID=2029368 RepID=UPI0022303D9F|nr:hypothetical protein [Haladaptatus sp. T7]